jgi:outer membrane autotransporter protein
VLGGTLAGTGTFQSINVGSGGTLAPGTPGVPGTFMTANGNLTFAPGAIYAVQLSPTAASRINVAGAVSLNGSVQGFLAPGAYAAKKTYDILDPASITGTFTGFTAVNAPGFTGTLTYNDPTDVLLTLTMNMGLAGMNGNQQSVATAINNTFNNGGTLPANFFPLTTLTGANLGNALMQIDGEAATGAEHSAFQSMTSFLNLMLDPFVDGRNNLGPGGFGGPATGFAPERPSNLPPAVALAYDSILKAPPAPSVAPRWNAWAAGYGGSGTANGNPVVGSSDITAQTFCYAAGVDYHVSPDALFGFALAGGGTNWGLAQGLGGGRSDAFQAGLYGKTFFGPAYLAADVGFANHWFTTNRTAFAGDQLTAKFDGQSYGGRFETGYRFGVLPTFGVTPYAAVQAQSFHTPTYSETDITGGGFGLTFNAMTATDTRSELGARFDDWQVVGGMPLILRGRIAWAHDWVSNPSLSAVFQSLPGANFIVNGAAIPKNSALTSAGAEWRINHDWSFTAKFDGEFASGAQTYAGTGVVRYTW